MKIVLDTTASKTKKKAKHSLQKRFDKLQQQLQTQKKLNQQFESDIHDLITRYQAELAEMDEKLFAPLTHLCHKLIDFYRRKSLAQWHREELTTWILETIEHIGDRDTDTAIELNTCFRQAVADQVGLSLEELDAEAQSFQEAMEEAFENFADEENLADDPQIDMFADFDEMEEEPFSHDAFREANKPGEQQKQLMDGSWVRSMFQRAAQALHPDRESDPEKRGQKERAMQQLLEARKEGDILALLELYNGLDAKDELRLAKEEMRAACELIEEQLHKLKQAQSRFLHEQPVRLFVYDQFYSRSKKKREKKFEQWKADVEIDASRITTLLAELRNLTALKCVLEVRREQHRYQEFDPFF